MDSLGPFSVKNRTIWVTGSSRGIGLGVGRHLLEQGACVVFHSRDKERLNDQLSDLGGSPEVSAVYCDVRSPEEVRDAVAEIARTHGKLDGLVANVGGASSRAAAETEPAQWVKMLELNLSASFYCAQATRELLAESGDGSLVIVGAVASFHPTPMFAGYGAAKAGVEHLVGSLAAEWGPEIRVNAVSPGLILTEGSLAAVFGGSQDLADRAGVTTAVGRLGQPSDIALACQYLLSPASAFVSGTVLKVDGGPVEGPTQRIMSAVNALKKPS